MKSYVVIGLGRFGNEIACQLAAMGREVLAMDVHSELVQNVSADVTHAVVADSRDKNVLRALGVADFDCAVVAIGQDLAASVLTVMNLKDLGVGQIICKANSEIHRRVLEQLGADRVVIPEKEHAIRLAKSLASANVLDYIDLSDEYGMIEVPAPKAWWGKSLIQLQVRGKLGINIIAVRRNGRFMVSPGADFTISAGDVMVVVGDNKALEKVQKL